MFWVGLDIQFGYLVRFALVISGFLYLVLIIPDRIVIVSQILVRFWIKIIIILGTLN